ncbi:MAG: hypothetical protein D6705_02405 [Deltaproteobacteria bacterium]|nr:MAG: hypothetical protein D6705_02405 [Deltaproteobacteria bacterium]
MWWEVLRAMEPSDVMGAMELPPAANTVYVGDAASFHAALGSAQPGDHIVLTADLGYLFLQSDVKGTPAAPVVIRADTVGGRTIGGFIRHDGHTLEHVMFYGIDFDALNYMVLKGAHITFRRCSFRMYATVENGLLQFGTGLTSDRIRYLRIDHSSFRLPVDAELPPHTGFGNNGDYGILVGKWSTTDDVANGTHDEYWVIDKCSFYGGFDRHNGTQPACFQLGFAQSTATHNKAEPYDPGANRLVVSRSRFESPDGWPMWIDTKLRASWWDRCTFHNSNATWTFRNGTYWALTANRVHGGAIEAYTPLVAFFNSYVKELKLFRGEVAQGSPYQDDGDYAPFWGAHAWRFHRTAIDTLYLGGGANWPYPVRDARLHASTVGALQTLSDGNELQDLPDSPYPTDAAGDADVEASAVGQDAAWERPIAFEAIDGVPWSAFLPVGQWP